MPLDLAPVTASDATFSAAGATAWAAGFRLPDTAVTPASYTLASITVDQQGRITAASSGTAGVTLNGITAATGAVTIASGNNTGIVWNWANTTNSTIAFTLGETTAATNGTSTSGVPNQVLFKLSTLALSTQSPLSIYARGTFVFGIAPSGANIIVGDSVRISCPTALTSGVELSGTTTSFFSAGFAAIQIVGGGTTQCVYRAGTAASPIITETNQNTGLFFDTSVIGMAVTGIENSRFAAGLFQASKAAADAVSYAINLRKARGTVASPTVITTGDDLATISGYGYVGGTNTYQEACRIAFDSTGTISDSATGIGGIIRFLHAIVGAEPAEVAMFRSQHLIHEGTSPTITAGGGTNPTIVGKDEAFEVTIGTGGIATSFEVTFGNAFTTNAPICGSQSDTDIIAFKNVSTTTTVTVTSTVAFTAGSKVHVICRGWE